MFKMRLIPVLVGTAAFFGICALQAFAKELPAPSERMDTLEVSGTVVSVSKQAFSLEFSRTQSESLEMVLPVDEKTRCQRFRGVSELRPGDRVKVKYQQTYEDGAEKEKKTILKTLATEIAMLKRAPEEGSLLSKEEASE